MPDFLMSFGDKSFLLLLPVLWAMIPGYRWQREWRARARQSALAEADGAEPPSLHPKIDPAICIGCGACAKACPEGRIIEMIGDKAHLIDPLSCIGHGACKAVCPVSAIELVFGTARRGVDIPVISPTFESNVPGLFIAGELGGMGLIANAIEQGRQAMDSIARHERIVGRDGSGIADVVIVGGGPAGISASLAAQEKGLDYVTIEQDTLGGTVARYPRGKLVMTRPAFLPRHGKVHLRRVRKERLLGLWHDVIAKWRVEIHEGRVDAIVARTQPPWGFDVMTADAVVPARTVLLATGRRGSPRRLGVPGEVQSKVVYSLDDARQYRGRHVTVVGGGDSAVEAVRALARVRTASLLLSYRGDNFARVKPANRQALETLEKAGAVQVLRQSSVRAIERDVIVIEHRGQLVRRPNQAVIICAGGVLPTALLTEAGVLVETKWGTA